MLYQCKEKSIHTGNWFIQREYDFEDQFDRMRYTARELYAWPGGYELSVIFSDGTILCGHCIQERYRIEMQELKDDYRTCDGIIGSQDIEEDTYCDHCNKNLNGYI